MAHNPCCCDCPQLGFDEAAWSWVTSCCSPNSPIINLKTDLSRLSECVVVFCGNNSFCGNAVRWDSGDWPTIATWIQNGGRLFIAAEHSGDYPATGEAFKCLQDMSNLNSFLNAIGSSMLYLGGDWNANSPFCSATYYSPGAANIAQGINFTGARFGEISEGSNGESVWLGPAGTGGSGSGLNKVACAVEQVGNGFVFLSGDSDSGSCTGYCDFIKRLWEYSDVQIL